MQPHTGTVFARDDAEAVVLKTSCGHASPEDCAAAAKVKAEAAQAAADQVPDDADAQAKASRAKRGSSQQATLCKESTDAIAQIKQG